MSGFTYDAFISYSHQDMQQARWLQRRLESFHVPRKLDAERSETGRLRIFRDQTDLAGAELQAALEREMQASRYLIVICSPASAASRWVNEEIRYFCSLGRADRIIPFIIDGEPNSDTPELECFPPTLRSGEVNEPLGVNIREIGKNKAFLKTASVLLGLRFNRLVDREKKRRLRTALTISGITAAALAVTGILVWNNIKITRKNQEISQENQELSYDIYAATLVEYYSNHTIDAEGAELLRKSAEAGNAVAMNKLANWYRTRADGEADEEQAFRWFLKSAEAGYAESMRDVGLLYMNGTGVAADPEQAMLWFERAMEAGDADSAAYLGRIYLYGIGVPQDMEKAREYSRKAAEGGCTLGLLQLANSYAMEQDYEQAFNCQKQLAELGDAFGMYNTGLMYQEAIGTEEDPQKAFMWYWRSAQAGQPEAMRMVGWCIENEYGIRGIDNIALQWYAKAADAGDENAVQDVLRIKNGTLKEGGDTE